MKKERERVVQERVPPLDIGLNISMERLKEIAQDLHKKLLNVYAAKFDLEQRKKRQDYDVSVYHSQSFTSQDYFSYSISVSFHHVGTCHLQCRQH